jgi:hypothetical protein
MDRALIQVKMDGSRLNEIFVLYNNIWATYEPLNAHELLIKGHITQMRNRLYVMKVKEQLKYTLSFGPVEALAFVQLWESAPFSLSPYQAQIIQSIFNILDKATFRAYRGVYVGNKHATAGHFS